MSRDFGAPSKPEPELAIAREAAQFLLPAPAPKGDNSGARDCLEEFAGAAGESQRRRPVYER